MPYEWQGAGSLTRVGDDDVDPGEVFEPTEAELRSFAGDIREVDPKGSDGEDGDAEDENDSESAESDGTDYAAMDYQELRQLAVEADTEEIDGRSSKDDIVAYLQEN